MKKEIHLWSSRKKQIYSADTFKRCICKEKKKNHVCREGQNHSQSIKPLDWRVAMPTRMLLLCRHLLTAQTQNENKRRTFGKDQIFWSIWEHRHRISDKVSEKSSQVIQGRQSDRPKCCSPSAPCLPKSRLAFVRMSCVFLCVTIMVRIGKTHQLCMSQTYFTLWVGEIYFPFILVFLLLQLLIKKNFYRNFMFRK